MNQPGRQVVRQMLAELLREPVDRVSNETRLSRLGGYDLALARELLRRCGVQVPDDKLRKLERVRDLLAAVEQEAKALSSRGEPAWQTGAQAALKAAAGAAVKTGPIPVIVPGPAAPPPAAVKPAPPGTFTSPTPYDRERIGAAALSCSDGRLGDQTDEFLHQGLGLPRYDRLTCPGGPVALSGRLMAGWECRGVEDQLRLLVRLHGLKRVVLIAHEDCGYYRDRLGVSAACAEMEQRKDLERAAGMIVRIDPAIAVSAFYARRDRDRVRFEPVAQAGPAPPECD